MPWQLLYALDTTARRCSAAEGIHTASRFKSAYNSTRSTETAPYAGYGISIHKLNTKKLAYTRRSGE
jgi:hypothetical protein